MQSLLFQLKGAWDRATCLWISGAHFFADRIRVQAYSERSGISGSSMTRCLALRSGDVQQNAGATVAVAQTMAVFSTLALSIALWSLRATANRAMCQS
ncbi:hypothetical protein DF033_37355 [Burkholderia cenocepacia]|nr:hypothetical protein DF033_37355 [Burkholderia cenocepacia]